MAVVKKWHIVVGFAFVIGFLISLPWAIAPQPKAVQVDQPGVVVEVLDPSLQWCADEWRTEIGRRFPNAVGLLLHGGDAVEGEWIVGASVKPGHVTPVRKIVDRYREMFPNRPIVLLACNTGNVTLKGMPNVFYFADSVWCLPDRSLKPEHFANDALKTISGSIIHLFPFEDPSAPARTRWEIEPAINGNIWEAQEAK